MKSPAFLSSFNYTIPKWQSVAHFCLPILNWLPKYSLRDNLNCDLVTGLTVGIMVVPQGMAYATLAGVAPVYGLYSCFFAAFFYMFFGTSRHISVGTFAVASMMVGSVLAERGAKQELHHHPLANNLTSIGGETEEHPTTMEVASALTLAVGIIQLLMAMCRLSFLTSYISDPLVSGFTTGAAIHVLTSQLDKLIGVHIRRYSGPGMLLFMWRDLALEARHANLCTVTLSAIGLTFLCAGREFVNPRFQARFRLPLPLELILVICAIVCSALLRLNHNYGVDIVAHVPNGMPLPAVPRLDVLPSLWPSAISLALVCYVFVFSLDKTFAKKHKYAVNANQQLFALGISSALCSLFPVYPFGAALSRSSLCEMTGAKSPLHALFSSALLLAVILWIGPWLEPLPMAILACIVAVSLKSLFLQVRVLPALARVSIFDALIWSVAFGATFLLDIAWGLVVSVLFSICCVVLREQWPRFGQVRSPPDFEPNVEVWHFESPLHFANGAKFVGQVHAILHKLAAHQATANGTDKTAESRAAAGRVLVMDCSAVSHIDSVGVDALAECFDDACALGVELQFAHFSDHLLHTFRRCGLMGSRIPEENFISPKTHHIA